MERITNNTQGGKSSLIGVLDTSFYPFILDPALGLKLRKL